MLPKCSAEFITKHGKYVSINIENVKKLSNNLAVEFNKGLFSLKTWKTHFLNPKKMDLNSIAWIFFCDTINFSFWPDDETAKFNVDYKGTKYTGYFSICAALNRSIDNGDDVLSPDSMRDMTVQRFNEIFRSTNGILLPMVDERVVALREAGRVLTERFEGHFVNCIIEADHSAQKLLSLIIDNFTSYRDVAMHENEKVCIYKRAQILIADIWCCFEGQDYGEFADIDTLTGFADYRVPQVLAHFGAIEYSEELKKDLEKKSKLPNGDRREVEIRGVSLQCIEMMVPMIKSQMENKESIVNSVLVDNYLWDYRRSKAAELESTPMHRTRCIYY